MNVDGLGISEAEIIDTLNTYPAPLTAQLNTPEGRDAFLYHLVRQKVLVRLAQQAGLDRETSYQLQVKKISEGMLISAYRQSLLQEMPELEGVTFSPPQSHIMNHIEASQIILKSLEDAKKALALVKSGTPFATVAKKMSTDKVTAPYGGRIRQTSRILLTHEPIVEAELRKLKDGQTSTILKVSQGYGIFRREGMVKAPGMSRDDVTKNAMIAQYEQQKVNQATASMQVVIDTAAVTNLIQRYSPTR